jgi:hypothetical protein
MFLNWWHRLDALANKVIPGYLGYKKYEHQMDKVEPFSSQLTLDCARIGREDADERG